MLVTSRELIQEIERMEMEIKIPVQANERIYENQVQPQVIENIRRCQEMMMESSISELTGDEVLILRDNQGIMKFASRIWIPNVPELKDEISVADHATVEPKRSNPFGNARPREEDWKEVDETLESLKLKEKEAAGLSDGPSFGNRSFDGYEDIAHEAKTGKIYKADYFDKHGRPVVVMKLGHEVINFRFILYFVGFIKDDEVDVKEVAAHVIGGV
ncbi:hypothetical protein AgCh_005301 [Apium graveolens]